MPTYHYHNLPIHYKKIGAGKPLIMLHGWGSSSDVLIHMGKRLSGSHACYIPDLPGFGQSPPPGQPWAVDDYADLVHSFIKDMKLEKPDVLAHSFGGRILLKLCSDQDYGYQPGRVLITGGAGMRPRRKPSFYFKKYFAKILKSPFLVLPARIREPALTWLKNTTLWNRLGSGDYKQLQGVMRDTFVNVVGEHLEPCLPRIPNEVLLLWGQNDTATPVYQARRMEEGIENAALVIIDQAGHYAFLDQPEKFGRIAEAFFKLS